mmetsp:Transcript_14242/g.24222  ORF Transcript_14242/g.24222 Transcript_14242/m.24222 type:complete len:131 (-) Transcript_14242:478-870(-)
MTSESVIAKLSYLIGKQYSVDKIKLMMMQSLRGEMTDLKRQQNHYTFQNNQMVQAVANALNVNDNPTYSKQISQTLMPLLVNSVISQADLSLVRQLGDEGADFNHIDYRGRAAIHIAVLIGDLKIVQYLI